MILVGCGLLYLGIKKEMEPLLLIPLVSGRFWSTFLFPV